MGFFKTNTQYKYIQFLFNKAIPQNEFLSLAKQFQLQIPAAGIFTSPYFPGLEVLVQIPKKYPDLALNTIDWGSSSIEAIFDPFNDLSPVNFTGFLGGVIAYPSLEFTTLAFSSPNGVIKIIEILLKYGDKYPIPIDIDVRDLTITLKKSPILFISLLAQAGFSRDIAMI